MVVGNMVVGNIVMVALTAALVSAAMAVKFVHPDTPAMTLGCPKEDAKCPADRKFITGIRVDNLNEDELLKMPLGAGEVFKVTLVCKGMIKNSESCIGATTEREISTYLHKQDVDPSKISITWQEGAMSKCESCLDLPEKRPK